MRDTNSTIRDMEKEVNKTFDAFRGKAVVSASEFLKELDVAPICGHIFKNYSEPWRYRHNPTTMLKAMLFMKMRGIKFQTQLVKHLKKNREDATNLGCGGPGRKGVPNRRTFNHFMHERLTKDIWLILDFVVSCSREAATGRGIMLGFAIPDKPKRKLSDRTFFRKKSSKTRELCRLMRKEIYPKVRLDLAHNSVFKQKDFLDMLTHVALTHDFTENGSNTFQMQRDERTPSADALLYHLKKYRHRKAVEGAFDGMFETVIAMAKRAGFLDRPLEVAIDITDIMYYGDRGDYMVVGTKPKKGTLWAFKFATVTAVVNGERLMLYAVPVSLGMTVGAVVSQLLGFLEGKARIRRVYADKGFYNNGVIEYLNSKGIEFLMPAMKTWRLRQLIGKKGAPLVTDYRLKDTFMKPRAQFKIVLVKSDNYGDDKIFAFATNMNTSEKLAPYFVDQYKKRWGIETAYRVKECFRARTTSKNYVIRLFYFMFSMTLYNLWVLVNSLLSLALFGKLPEKPLVTAKMFGVMLYTVEIT